MALDSSSCSLVCCGSVSVFDGCWEAECTQVRYCLKAAEGFLEAVSAIDATYATGVLIVAGMSPQPPYLIGS